ncbi:MAG: hypothetical protein HC837_08385 [Chloroflexaceae bacterium]|nr:hypothetical protein [Chloroflexaceae bacterium]
MSDMEVPEQIRKQFLDAQDIAMKSMRAWNELLLTSTDMAFDVVLKNWNYNRSLRSSAEQAVEDTFDTQRRLSNEMMQVWQGYTNNVQQIVGKAIEGK